MPGFEESVLTDAGLEALTDAEAGQHIEYTHMEAGDGDIYGGDTEIYGMTALNHHVMDFPITNFSNDGDGQITLVGVISSKNVTTGFYFKELAVRCTIDGGAPILYTVSYAGETGDYIPASTETPVVIQTVQIIIRIDRAPNVTVIVQPGLDVTAQNIGPATVGPGYFRDKIGQILWFKRINSPKKTLSLTETSDVVSIDIPTVDINLDMFVALGNPDIFPNFSTIQNALNYLIPLQIKPGITVTITVSAGTWNLIPTTIVDHPQGSQIKIIGTAGPVKNVTTTVRGTGSDVILSGAVGVYNDMTVGDWFLLKNNAASYVGKVISGVWKVKAKAGDGSSITFEEYFWGTLPSLGPVTGGTVTPIKTVIQSPFETEAFHIKNNGLGLLKHIVIVGNDTPASGAYTGHYGLIVEAGKANLEKVGATNWFSTISSRAFGIGAYGTGILECLDCAANKNSTGFNVTTMGAQVTLRDCFGNSNDYSGIRNEGAQMTTFNCAACGNDFTGMICAHNGSGGINGTLAAHNKQYGIWVSLNAYATGNEGQCSFNLNGTRDIQLTVTSTYARVVGPAVSYGTVNIAPYSLSADGCYFGP